MSASGQAEEPEDRLPSKPTPEPRFIKAVYSVVSKMRSGTPRSGEEFSIENQQSKIVNEVHSLSILHPASKPA
jgi:hypothetical protein